MKEDKTMIHTIMEFFGGLHNNPYMNWIYKGVVLLAGSLILTSYSDAIRASKRERES